MLGTSDQGVIVDRVKESKSECSGKPFQQRSIGNGKFGKVDCSVTCKNKVEQRRKKTREVVL